MCKLIEFLLTLVLGLFGIAPVPPNVCDECGICSDFLYGLTLDGHTENLCYDCYATLKEA